MIERLVHIGAVYLVVGLGAFAGSTCFDALRKTCEYMKCRYGEGHLETIYAHQFASRRLPAELTPIKIVRIDQSSVILTVKALAVALAALSFLGVRATSVVTRRAMLLGMGIMLLLRTLTYPSNLRNSLYKKRAAIIVKGKPIDTINALPPFNDKKIRVYTNNLPFLTSQPVSCPDENHVSEKRPYPLLYRSSTELQNNLR